MAKNQHVALAFGMGHWVPMDSSKVNEQLEIVKVLKENNITIIDTARLYGHGESEKSIGQLGLGSDFDIITKPRMSLAPGGGSKEVILEDWKSSAEALKVEKIPYFILHNPDDKTPISETMEGIQELYLAGKIGEFGLSNFTSSEVEEYYNHAASKNYILPTVYQGTYSLIARQSEQDLFPTLRRLGIKFQAYSVMGAGFLTKTPDDIRNGRGNYDPNFVLGKILGKMYGKDEFFKYLEEYEKLANESGNSKIGLAHRWIVWSSTLGEGDCVILGARTAGQLRETISEIEKGPLENLILEKLEIMFKWIENDDPGNNFSTFKKLKATGELEGKGITKTTT